MTTRKSAFPKRWRSVVRQNNMRVQYRCLNPSCKKKFKSVKYRPHCPVCGYGLAERVFGGT